MLPVAQAWHMHAVLQPLYEAQGGQEPLLRGPLASGEEPSEWRATLRAARAAFDKDRQETRRLLSRWRTGRQGDEDEGEGEDEDEGEDSYKEH